MASTGHGADVSRQREEVIAIGQQFLSQLAPGSEEYNQLQAAIAEYAQNVGSPANEQGLVRDLGQQLVSKQQQRIAEGGAATPLEARTNKQFDAFREVSGFAPEEQAVLNALRGQSGETPTDQVLNDIVMRAQDESGGYQSTLDQQLQLAFDQINRQAAQRGIVDSGLPLELSQRAAAELAINEAAARQQSRQQALSNFQDLFNVGGQLRNREIGVEGAFTDIQRGRETDLTNIANQNNQLGFANQVDTVRRGTAAAEADAQRRREEEEQKKANLANIAKQIAYIGADVFLPGSGTALRTADSLLSQKRSQENADPVSSLSRISQGSANNSTSLDALLKTFGASGKVVA